jgi:transcriptional regulator with XRE-family HTH domain
MNTTITLGDRIREARGTLTQYELADRIRSKRPKIKVTDARISRYERNAQSPRLSVLVAIAEATGKTLDFFRVDSESDGGEQSNGEADEDDSHAMMRAAYHLDRSGEYAMADDLRMRARKAALKTRRERVS